MQVIVDTIHGDILLDDIAIRIINTCEFQRLRFIRQLGACWWIFPGATHTRLEHSLGVYHLSKQVMTYLQQKHLDVKITDREIQLVALAGLTHDLGHCVLGHTFDSIVLPNLLLHSVKKPPEQEHQQEKKEKSASVISKTWIVSLSGMTHHHDHDHHHPNQSQTQEQEQEEIEKMMKHENRSERLLRFMQNKYHWELDSSELDFICDVIQDRREKYPSSRQFLFEIVANTHSHIDWDKLDYLSRDAFHLGIGISFRSTDLFKYMKIIEGHLSFHEDAKVLLDMIFTTRSLFHKRFYKNESVVCVSAMLTSALLMAEPELKLIEKLISLDCQWITLTDEIFSIMKWLPSIPLVSKSILTQIESGHWISCKKSVSGISSDPLHFQDEFYITQGQLEYRQQSPIQNTSWISSISFYS